MRQKRRSSSFHALLPPSRSLLSQGLIAPPGAHPYGRRVRFPVQRRCREMQRGFCLTFRTVQYSRASHNRSGPHVGWMGSPFQQTRCHHRAVRIRHNPPFCASIPGRDIPSAEPNSTSYSTIPTAPIFLGGHGDVVSEIPDCIGAPHSNRNRQKNPPMETLNAPGGLPCNKKDTVPSSQYQRAWTAWSLGLGGAVCAGKGSAGKIG
jgi:hypothetical protein